MIRRSILQNFVVFQAFRFVSRPDGVIGVHWRKGNCIAVMNQPGTGRTCGQALFPFPAPRTAQLYTRILELTVTG